MTIALIILIVLIAIVAALVGWAGWIITGNNNSIRNSVTAALALTEPKFTVQMHCSSCGKVIDESEDPLKVEAQVPLAGNKIVAVTMNICGDCSD